MDVTTATLVDYAMSTGFSALPADAVRECKRRLIDTLGCAMGAYDEPVSRMARTVAMRYAGGRPAATVWGSGRETTADAAAFANGVMLRALDLSDMYRVESGGHPSDTIAALWAVGEAAHADGASLINAVTLAYDVYCSFCEAIDINSKGWDQPVYSVLACVLGAGKLLNLDRGQMGHAVALALAPNLALHQTRRGELSSWKDCAGANASRNAVFAAYLAQDGFTGPSAVFAGKGGLWDIIGRFDWQVKAGAGAPHRVTLTHMKSFPVCYHAQSAAWAALEMRPRLRIQDISAVRVETYRQAVEFTGSDPACWAPQTPETADHSIPYVVAAALLDGKIAADSFAETRLGDAAIGALMRNIEVAESAEFSAQYPAAAPCRLKIRLKSGDELASEIKYPKGHINNLLTDAELDEKFRGLFRQHGTQDACEATLRGLWHFEEARDIGSVLQPLRPES